MMVSKLKKGGLVALIVALSLAAGACSAGGANVAESPASDGSGASEGVVSPSGETATVKTYDPDSIGLSDPTVVGVDKERFESEILYPAPSDAYVVDVPAPAYLYEDSTAAVQRAIKEAKDYAETHDGAKVTVKFPAGKFAFYEGAYDKTLAGYDEDEYVFEDGVNGRYAMFLNGCRDLTIEGTPGEDGVPATEMILFGENGFYFARVKDCENVRFVNFAVDYGVLPYYFGEVVEKPDNNTLIIRTWNDYPVTNTDIECYIEYDKDTNMIRDAANNKYNASGSTDNMVCTIENGDLHLIRIKFKDKMTLTPLGTKVALSNMKTDGNDFFVTKSKNVYFETVYAYCGGGSAVLSRTNENLFFNRFMAVVRPGTDRLLTIAGDVLHLEDTKGEIRITNSKIENTHDDGVNICGHYMYPYSASGDTAVLMYRGNASQTYECYDGDVLAKMDRRTMKVDGYYKVRSTEYKNGRYYVSFYKGGTAVLPSGETVAIEEDLSGIGGEATSVLSNVTRAPKVLVENCLVRNKRNRGLLIQTRNAVVRNCEFVNVVNTAVMFIGEMASFCESTLPSDVTVENCKFVNCDSRDIQVAAYNVQNQPGEAGAIERVTIRNNLFAYQQNDYSLYITSVDDLDISHNVFYKPQTGTKKTGFATSAIMFRYVRNVNFDKNLLDKFLPTRGGVSVWDGVDVETFSWGENEGFEKREVFGDEEAVAIARLDADIKIDGSIADWAKLEATEFVMDNVTNVHIQRIDFSTVPKSDFSATVKAFVRISDGDDFDEKDGLYFYFNVTDDEVRFERSAWWTGDCMECYLSSDVTSHDEIGVIRDDPGTETMQLAVKGDADGNCVPCVYPGRTTSTILEKLEYSTEVSNAEYLGGAIKTAFALTRNGYRGEVFIPFSLFNICGNKLKNGESIAFVVCVVDSYETGEDELLAESMTFSHVGHPTCNNNKVPATMTKFCLKGV